VLGKYQPRRARPCANRNTSEEVNGDAGAICEIKLRFDCINVFGEVYQLRDGTGLGGNATQYGQRGTFLMNVLDFRALSLPLLILEIH
jgi:hypothetical protein